MKFRFKLLCVTLCLALSAAAFTGCSGQGASSASGSAASASATGEETHEPGLFIDGQKVEADPVLTFNGEEVSFDLYRYIFLTFCDRVAGDDSSYWEDMSNSETAQAAETVKLYTLNNALSFPMFRQWAEELGVSLTEEETAEIEQVAADWEGYFGSEEEYENFLAINHLTKELAIQMELDTQLSNKVLEAAYGDAIKADVLENFVHVQHVLIQFEDAEADDHSAELAKAQEVLEKAQAGEDFNALMEEYNEDPGEPEEGYYFPTGVMVQEFEDASFALQDGEISDIVETSYGYHIIKRLPLDESYIDTHLLDLAADSSVNEQMQQDMDERIRAGEIWYCDVYDQISPATLFKAVLFFETTQMRRPDFTRGGASVLFVAVHLFVIFLVIAAGDVGHPFLMGKIPVNGFHNALFKRRLGVPAQFVFDFLRVNAIPPVVAKPICHIADECFIDGVVRKALVQLGNDGFYNKNVRPLVMAAHIVHLAHTALFRHHINGLAVVLYIQPIAHVHAIAVHRQAFVVLYIVNHQRNQLFRELIGAIVVRAARDVHRHAVGVVERHDEHICAGFGRRVRAVRAQRRRFGEIALGAKAAVHFIGGNLHIFFPRRPLAVLLPCILGALQKVHRAQHVRLYKNFGVRDAAVHMALGGKVDDAIEIILQKQLFHQGPVADIALHKHMAAVALYPLQVFQIARIGELIQVHQQDFVIFFQHVIHEVRANEPRAACDEIFFQCSFPFFAAGWPPFFWQMGSFPIPVFKKCGQRLLPRAHLVAHGAAQHAVVQRAPRGPVRCRRVRGLILGAGARRHRGLQPGQAHNFFCELIPRAHALTCAVVYAVFLGYGKL